MKQIGPPEAPLTDATYRLWTAELEDVDTGFSEIWVDQFRLRGSGRVAGGFFFKPLRILQIGPVDLGVLDGELRLADDTAVRGIELSMRAQVGAIRIGEPVVRAVRDISMSGRVDAELANVNFMQLYLPPSFPASLQDGGGSIHADLRLVNGVALPPTTFRVESERLLILSAPVISVLDVTAEARVTPSSDGPVASAEVRVRDATVIRRGSSAAPLVVNALAQLRGLPRDLAGALRIEHTHLDVSTKGADVAMLLPPATSGKPSSFALDGRASARVEVDLDDELRGAGHVEGSSKRLHLSTSALDAAAALSVKVSFDDANVRERTLRVLPSALTVEDLVITRGGRAHPGGAVRVDVTRGAIQRGVARDFEVGLRARFADLGWVSSPRDAKGGYASARAGALDAKLSIPRPGELFDGSAGDTPVTGSVALRGTGEGRFRDVSIRGHVAATTTIERLDVARRTLALGKTHVDLRDVEIRRGDDRTSGWWASLDATPLEGKALGPLVLAAHVDMRCQSGKPFLAALATTGTIPGWVGSIFPMNDLRATANVSRWREQTEVGLGVSSTSMNVKARLYDVGSAMNGAVLVKTPVVSLGVRLEHGKSHLRVFAGDGWLKEQLAAAQVRHDR